VKHFRVARAAIGARIRAARFPRSSTKNAAAGSWKRRAKRSHSTMHDPDWIHAALERHERGLIRFAARLTGDVETARELTQELFLRLCEAERSAVEPKLAAWLYAACRNAALDHGRKSARRGRVELRAMEEHPDGTSPLEVVETRDESVRVREELARLPENQREALHLRVASGLSYREIAQVTGDTLGNVSWLIHAGLKTLRGRLGANALEGRA
jgi:RNA polymerase sigma-70 factor (ECF subfamily)